MNPNESPNSQVPVPGPAQYQNSSQAQAGGPAMPSSQGTQSGAQPKMVKAPSGASNPNSTQNTLHISEIRDGIVILNDGTFRAVVMCQSINFDLMSPGERESVEFNYQGFLNSLYFPIQIFMRSKKVDLDPYLDRLVKIRAQQESMLLGVLIEDYVNFLSEIAQRTNIMDKKFYIVIGYPDFNADIRRILKQSTGFFSGVAELFSRNKTPHIVINEDALEKAKTELRNRVEAVMQGLLQCGVQSVPLDTRELIELYYEAYNPDTASNQKLADPNDLNVPIVTKGEGSAPQPHLDGTTS